jgi:hypothetical protein
MKVHIYRNLKTKEPQLSIRCANSHLVLGHCEAVIIAEANFIVQPSGLLRTRATKQRNVHAWVSGQLTYVQDFTPYKERTIDYDYDLPFEPNKLLQDFRDSATAVHIHYNPYHYESFVDDYGYPVNRAVAACVWADGTITGEFVS